MDSSTNIKSISGVMTKFEDNDHAIGPASTERTLEDLDIEKDMSNNTKSVSNANSDGMSSVLLVLCNYN